MIKVLKLLVLCFLITGCAVFSQKNAQTNTKREGSKNGKVVDLSRLMQGGKVLIVPFRAGQGVAQNDHLDKIALACVKGIADSLMERRSLFEILTARNADDVELMIKGHVTEFAQPRGAVAKWLPVKKPLRLSVEGQMVDVKTGKVVLYFSYTETLKQKDADGKTVAYMMGQAIGQFVIGEIPAS